MWNGGDLTFFEALAKKQRTPTEVAHVDVQTVQTEVPVPEVDEPERRSESVDRNDDDIEEELEEEEEDPMMEIIKGAIAGGDGALNPKDVVEVVAAGLANTSESGSNHSEKGTATPVTELPKEAKTSPYHPELVSVLPSSPEVAAVDEKASQRRSFSNEELVVELCPVRQAPGQTTNDHKTDPFETQKSDTNTSDPATNIPHPPSVTSHVHPHHSYHLHQHHYHHHHQHHHHHLHHHAVQMIPLKWQHSDDPVDHVHRPRMT
eukprot:TRINITY_DN1400_c1_g1_i2.p1 TRINITY_DN1400_c1_g1~~TRINITY_DN1400_c1_g1_i2.p1  ORF type:complete len:262 (+),score=67.09 TRINITY_DN1400_c1_g1_i2:68-853(+)